MTLSIPTRPAVTPLRLKSRLPSLRVLGVDPSLTNTGVALIEDGRVLDLLVLTTPAKDDEAVRLQHLHMALARVLEMYKPDEVAMEEFVAFYGRTDPYAMYLMKGAQAVCQLAVIQSGIPLRRYAPKVWKPGGEQKDATIRLMQAKYGIETRDNNACDAVAIADYHLRLGRLQKPAIEPSSPPESGRVRKALAITRPAARVAHGELLVEVPPPKGASRP